MARRPSSSRRSLTAARGELPGVAPKAPLRPVFCVGKEEGNLLVHADNREGLAWLRRSGFGGRFRCVYIDPPFNTGRKFAEYIDSLDPVAWHAMMLERLEAIHPLLAEDGALVAEIDDTELGSLQRALDQVFGRENRVSTVTVVRSAPTGHKAKNRGPVNTTDFLLVYAKRKAKWRTTPLFKPRRGLDGAYRTVIPNVRAEPHTWTFRPLGRVVAERLGCSSTTEAARRHGLDFERAIERFALDEAHGVVRFAQPRYEAVSQKARHAIDRSRADPKRVFLLERSGHPPLYLRGGNRILFLADKVREIEGRRVLVEPLTNVWDDVPFQGIAREGGVVFSRNKKPERLLARILEMTTEPGDWVLDPFLGSGTTAAVSLKMGRRWVGIEAGAHAWTLAIDRLGRVVRGEDTTGITRRTEWQGGGGFVVLQ